MNLDLIEAVTVAAHKARKEGVEVSIDITGNGTSEERIEIRAYPFVPPLRTVYSEPSITADAVSTGVVNKKLAAIRDIIDNIGAKSPNGEAIDPFVGKAKWKVENIDGEYREGVFIPDVKIDKLNVNGLPSYEIGEVCYMPVTVTSVTFHADGPNTYFGYIETVGGRFKVSTDFRNGEALKAKDVDLS